MQLGICFVQTRISTLKINAVGFFEVYVHLIHQTKGRNFNEDRNLDIQRRRNVQSLDKIIYEFKYSCTHYLERVWSWEA